MPAVYAVISFFSYRFFRSYTYYSLIESGALLTCLTSETFSQIDTDSI